MRSLLLFCFLLMEANAFAMHHINSWFRATLSIPAERKFRFDAEFQHRRQNGFGNQNPYDKNLMFSFRIWGVYRVNDKVMLWLSPFAYFTNNAIINRLGDELKPANNEYRFAAAVDFQNRIKGKWFAIFRPGIEYRMFDFEPKHIVRLRYRVGVRYDFSQKLSMQLFDEVFMNIGDYSKINSFDHNRIFLQLHYTPHPTLRFEAGYIFVNRLPRTATETYPESNVVMNIAYSIPFKKN